MPGLEPEEKLKAEGLQGVVAGVEANCRGESQGRKEMLSSVPLASVDLQCNRDPRRLSGSHITFNHFLWSPLVQLSELL